MPYKREEKDEENQERQVLHIDMDAILFREKDMLLMGVTVPQSR